MIQPVKIEIEKQMLALGDKQSESKHIFTRIKHRGLGTHKKSL